MKNEMNEISVEKGWNEICGRRKREKPREKPTQTPVSSTIIILLLLIFIYLAPKGVCLNLAYTEYKV